MKRNHSDQKQFNQQRKTMRRQLAMNRRGFGINEVIGIAAGIIIAAAVIIPGLKTFAGTVMTELSGWWTSMSTELFTG